MTIATHVAISFGLGGSAVDDAISGGYGENYLVRRCRALPNADVMNSPYEWSDAQKIYDDIMRHPPTDRFALVGDSLGDNELGDILAALKGRRTVDLIGGFQGSEWGKHTTIPDNCRKAILIFNPIWFETMGLGAYPLPLDVPPVVPPGQNLYDGRWRTGNNGKTQVRYVQIEAPHPDDWGEAQDIVFAEIRRLAAS
jgi:hypothetical protein